MSKEAIDLHQFLVNMRFDVFGWTRRPIPAAALELLDNGIIERVGHNADGNYRLVKV